METYQKLERAFASFVGMQAAVSVNTGTAALHLALAALRIGPGDEVIVPDFTMAACAFAVMYTGATPVFVDCGGDLNIDVTKLAASLTPRTKAIMPVHVYGRTCNMEAIARFARKHGLRIVEDCSEAHGATMSNGHGVGKLADVACFSLYRNKIVHAEEGGMCTTDQAWLATRMRDLKNMAFGTSHDYFHSELAFNYRMPNAQAALALASLSRVDKNLNKRRKIEGWYDERLRQHAIPRPVGSVLWMYDILCGEEAQAKILAAVPGSRPFFKPMSSQPFCKRPEVGKRALMYSQQGVYLPVREDMTRAEVAEVCEKVVAILPS